MFPDVSGEQTTCTDSQEEESSGDKEVRNEKDTQGSLFF